MAIPDEIPVATVLLHTDKKVVRITLRDGRAVDIPLVMGNAALRQVVAEMTRLYFMEKEIGDA